MIRFAVRAVSLAAFAFVAGCTHCGETTSSTENIAVPPPRCDGRLLASSRECPSTTRVAQWTTLAGEVVSYDEARLSWREAQCTLACEKAGFRAASCTTAGTRGDERIECVVRKHDDACEADLGGGYQSATPGVSRP